MSIRIYHIISLAVIVIVMLVNLVIAGDGQFIPSVIAAPETVEMAE